MYKCRIAKINNFIGRYYYFDTASTAINPGLKRTLNNIIFWDPDDAFLYGHTSIQTLCVPPKSPSNDIVLDHKAQDVTFIHFDLELFFGFDFASIESAQGVYRLKHQRALRPAKSANPEKY